jgi:hypothetical protein
MKICPKLEVCWIAKDAFPDIMSIYHSIRHNMSTLTGRMYRVLTRIRSEYLPIKREDDE